MTPDDRTNDLTWSKEVSQQLSDEDAANSKKALKSSKNRNRKYCKPKLTQDR